MNQGFFDAEKKRTIYNLIVDKVDLCLAMEYFEELKDISTLAKSLSIQKVIMTTTVIDEDEQSAEDG